MHRILVFLLAAVLFAQVRELHPGFNLFTPQQDIELGKEAAAKIVKDSHVVKNAELTAYLTAIVARLAKSSRAGTFPFTFTILNDQEVNAFALPGGPMFVNTGLIAAVDNESQLAGVLAHEMSHVALRHGTHEVSKANLIQIPAALASSMVSNDSVLGELAKLGIDFGAQSILMQYSRSAEHDADINGARIMQDAHYDPREMARFFVTLEKTDPTAKTAEWLSDHPSPGNRVQYVGEEIRHLPAARYQEMQPGMLTKAKAFVARLPDPPNRSQPANASADVPAVLTRRH
jgi:predicted Zn-dependent protease